MTLIDEYLCGKIELDTYKEDFRLFNELARIEIITKRFCNKYNRKQLNKRIEDGK